VSFNKFQMSKNNKLTNDRSDDSYKFNQVNGLIKAYVESLIIVLYHPCIKNILFPSYIIGVFRGLLLNYEKQVLMLYRGK